MTTTEILSAFMKGNEKVSISQKQKDWLLSQARRENVKVSNSGYADHLFFSDCHYTIKQCKTLASGGSYVGTRMIQGRYNIEKLYTIKFDSTGLTAVYAKTDLDYFKTTPHTFHIINQFANQS